MYVQPLGGELSGNDQNGDIIHYFVIAVLDCDD